MTIHEIKVENVKGASSLNVNLKILPNKPSLMVAPNGFGKSSITAAFASLIPSKLKLAKELLHKGEEANKPTLTIDIENAGGVREIFFANEQENRISSRLDVFVINGRLGAKATKRNMGSFTSASASLEIAEVILVDKIPARATFNYSIVATRKKVGINGKVIPNIDAVWTAPQTTNEFIPHFELMEKITGAKAKTKIDRIVENLNTQKGSAEAIQNWLDVHHSADLESIECIRTIADIFSNSNTAPPTRIEALLSAYQVCTLYAEHPRAFKNACLYNSYLAEKENFTQVIDSFDTTWKNVKPKEKGGKLVVEFPSASDISNGQRDSLCFAASMQRAKKRIGKRDCLLIIDEVFDYLDDANLAAVQYFISNLIAEVKGGGNRIYPLIFTHLNPTYFKNYAFKDQKVYFLDKRPAVISEHFIKLLQNREDPTIKQGIEKYHLHFDPGTIDLQAAFLALGLKETWGKSDIFYAHLFAEWGKYIGHNGNFDPFAVCCFIRVNVEHQIYKKINDPVHLQQFLDTHGTKKKLEYADGIGIEVPEVCYLLGVIYNEGLHYRSNVDNSSPIAAKLSNLIIRKMAREATNH